MLYLYRDIHSFIHTYIPIYIHTHIHIHITIYILNLSAPHTRMICSVLAWP